MTGPDVGFDRDGCALAGTCLEAERIQGTKVNALWLRDFVTYDPAPVLAGITLPVLAIAGGRDLTSWVTQHGGPAPAPAAGQRQTR